MTTAAQPEIQTHDRVCPLCRSDNRDQPPGLYSSSSWRVKTCPHCRFTYLENVPEYTELEDNLSWEKTYAAESQRRLAKRGLRKRISRSLKNGINQLLRRDKIVHLADRYFPSGPVIDIGCGHGDILARLPEACEPHGIEISRELAARADALVNPRGGQVVQASAVDGVRSLPANHFNGAILMSFLEHESDPAGLLKGLSRSLAASGCAIIKVPNFGSLNRRIMGRRWCGFRYPDHVNYFTPEHLRRMLADCGFRVVRSGFLDRLPTSDNFWTVAAPVRGGTGSDG